MTALNITLWPAEVLTRPARPADVTRLFDFGRLAQDMVDTCEVVKGLGLAAPQVGVDLQLFVLDVGSARGTDEGYETFVNPSPIWSACSGDVSESEGCLSIPGHRFDIKRFSRFVMDYTGIDGSKQTIEATGHLARALQHEYDHLTGKIIVDSLSPWRKTQVRKKMDLLRRRMKQRGLTYLDVVKPGESEK